MAKYSYNELKKAAINKSKIGSWKGVGVYSCSKYDYNAASPHFWVIYDSKNELVKGGYVYGNIDDRGQIDECSKYWFNVPVRSSERTTKKVPATSGYSDQVIADEFFSRLDREINELLAGVSELKLSQGELEL